MPDTRKLGDLSSSEALIKDLYLDLRAKTRFWSGITKQTAQARMGYIGQHLVSIVTGYSGGKSGARGADLVRSDGRPGEIKTCYRVDQLGACQKCGSGVATDELLCAKCGSKDIERKDDSKWLIGIKDDKEFSELLIPFAYYLVLFEFEDLTKPDTIIASIWTVDPTCPGFLLCMVDYYKNIQAKSKSKAPFNFWPYALKFELMKPKLIYRSRIKSDNSIATLVFPGISGPVPEKLTSYERARVPDVTWDAVASSLDKKQRGKSSAFTLISDILSRDPTANDRICDLIALKYYGPLVEEHVRNLPMQFRGQVETFIEDSKK